MKVVEDAVEMVQANSALMEELAPMVELLNGLNDDRVPWQACFGRKDYVDAFGVPIPAGLRHYRKGYPSQQEDEVRLAASSMQKYIEVTFAHNIKGLQLAQRVVRERREEIRQAVSNIRIRPQRDELPPGAT